MTDPVCERASLVEASLDDRLGPTERASVDRHLKTCASCSELARELLAIRETLRAASTEIAPIEHQRARLALLRVAAVPAPRKRPIALLAAAAVMIPFAVWAAAATVSSLRAPDRDQGTPPAPTATTAPTAPLAPAPTATAASAEPEAMPAPPPSVSTPVVAMPVVASARPHPSSVASAPTHAAPSSSSTASQDFAKAMDSIARGDFGAGARELEQFASAHPSDARVEEAVYLQAIALQRAGRVEEAKAAARRYLTTYPSGAHRTQAQRLAGD